MQRKRSLLKKISVGLMLIGTILLLTSTHVRATHHEQDDFSRIDSYIETKMQENGIPGLAMAIVQGDQIVHMKGIGKANEAGEAVTPQSVFRIGSLTKSFTALAIMQLVEAGKIELDAPVQRYLPWFQVKDPVASAQIAVRHLLNHTSGIPYNTPAELKVWTTQTDMSMEEFVRDLRNVALGRPVGTAEEYSNVNYSTLGLIVEAVSGQPYGQYVSEHIFGPLQMQRSYTTEQKPVHPGAVQGYQQWFGIPRPTPVPYGHAFLSAGEITSTAEDMAHYLIAQLNGGKYDNAQVLSPEGITQMHTPPVSPEIQYAMGWVKGIGGDDAIVWHNGSTNDFHAMALLHKEKRSGVVLLTNMSGLAFHLTEVVERMGVGVMKLLQGQEAQQDAINTGLYYLIANPVLLILLLSVVTSAIRLPRWKKRFEQRLLATKKRGWLYTGLGTRLFLEILLPAYLLLRPALDGYTSMRATAISAADLVVGYLLLIGLLLLTGFVRAIMVLQIWRRKKQEPTDLTPQPTPSPVTV